MSYECKICGRTYEDAMSFALHIKNDHKLGMQEYYDKFLKKEGEGICKICGKPTTYNGLNKGYAEYCSTTCSNKAPKQQEYTELKCEICDMMISADSANAASKKFNNHLKKEHNIYNPKLYYDTYVRKEDEGYCPTCHKETTFISVIRGYEKYCSDSTCMIAHQRTLKDDPNTKLHNMLNIRNMMKKIADSISEKYNNFLKSESKKSFGDVRTNPITHKTVKSTKQIATIDGTSTELKTEISSSTQQDPYLGTQRMYRPKQESCSYHYNCDKIIDDGNSIDETEWCR